MNQFAERQYGGTDDVPTVQEAERFMVSIL